MADILYSETGMESLRKLRLVKGKLGMMRCTIIVRDPQIRGPPPGSPCNL